MENQDSVFSSLCSWRAEAKLSYSNGHMSSYPRSALGGQLTFATDASYLNPPPVSDMDFVGPSCSNRARGRGRAIIPYFSVSGITLTCRANPKLPRISVGSGVGSNPGKKAGIATALEDELILETTKSRSDR